MPYTEVQWKSNDSQVMLQTSYFIAIACKAAQNLCVPEPSSENPWVPLNPY